MRDVLLGPFAIAALVLGIAGLAKLRAPAAAARAAMVLGVPAVRSLVRALAVSELILAIWCLVSPGALSAGLLAGAYASFTVIAYLLARRQSSCGCFGADEGPAGPAHWLLSGLLALLTIAAVAWTPHGLLWALERHPALSAVLGLGVAGAAYALVIVYTQLPLAWSAWSDR